MAAGSPFGLAAQLLRRASGIQDGEPLETRRDKLVARIVGTGRSVPQPPEEPERAFTDRRLAEFLGEVVGAPFPDAASVQLRAARLQLEAADQVQVNCRRFAVHSSESTDLQTEGDLHVAEPDSASLRDPGNLRQTVELALGE